VRRLADAWLRLLGADPVAFRPLYRTQKLMLRRQTRIIRTQRRGFFSGLTPYLTLCLFAGIYGLCFIALVLAAKSPLLGSALAVTLGCCFLLLVVISEHFDVLVNPREALVLGAHPYDQRSFLLAKLAAVGGSLGLLAALLFAPPTLAIGISSGSPVRALAFAAGALAAITATVSLGLLSAAALLRIWGRKAMDRLMPWFQGIFQMAYFFVIGGSRLLGMMSEEGLKGLGALPWVLPPFWFLAPFEMAVYGSGAAPLVRLLLAMATLALLLTVATRWLGSGLRVRLLEPESRKAAAAPSRIPRRRSRISAGRSEAGRLFALLRVHLRSDWRIRSEFLLVPVMGIFLMLFYFPSQSGALPGLPMTTFLYTWVLIVSADVLTRASRPEALWFLLTAPLDRTRFSMGTVGLVRAFQLAPLFLAAAWLELRRTGAWPHHLAVLLELLALGDLLILLAKVIFPDFPFSRPSRSGSMEGRRVVLMLLGGLASGLATALVFGLDLLGTPGALAGAALFFLLRFPAVYLARRRAADAAARLELAGGTGV
jgi:hypothetical protein